MLDVSNTKVQFLYITTFNVMVSIAESSSENLMGIQKNVKHMSR